MYLEKVRHSILLNLSNQANTNKCKGTNLSQYNFVVILGLEYLNILNKKEAIPLSFIIDREGNLSINGLDGESMDERNIRIYSDKKITESD